MTHLVESMRELKVSFINSPQSLPTQQNDTYKDLKTGQGTDKS